MRVQNHSIWSIFISIGIIVLEFHISTCICPKLAPTQVYLLCIKIDKENVISNVHVKTLHLPNIALTTCHLFSFISGMTADKSSERGRLIPPDSRAILCIRSPEKNGPYSGTKSGRCKCKIFINIFYEF